MKEECWKSRVFRGVCALRSWGCRAGAVFPGEYERAAFSTPCFLALVATSGVTGNFKMRWDNDNNSGKKMLKDDLL